LKYKILSDTDREKIHKESLRILSDIGVRFYSKRALKLLKEAGALVDSDSCIARIDKRMVENALESAPKSFTLGARNSAFDFPMPSAYTAYTLDGTASFALDFETGQRRYGTSKDIERASRIFETLELGMISWPPVIASDAPSSTRVLYEFLTAVKSTSKHVQHELHRPEEVPFLIEALKTILGSIEAVKDRKICSVCYCPVAPLTHEGPMSEACLDLVAYNVPVLIYPMPSCGSTGPAALFPNICLANAEALSTLVLFQAEAPGSPQIYGSALGTMDFKTGSFLEGTPEMVMQTAAMGEMARHYKLPNTQAGCLSDARGIGPEAIMEKMITTLPLVMAGVDVINGIGEIETSQLLVLEQLLVDEEIALRCKRLAEGIDYSEQKNLFEEIKKVGPGGHFLSEEGTFRLCRSKEFYQPFLSGYTRQESEEGEKGDSIYKKARERVTEILSGPTLNALPDKTMADIDDLLIRATKELVQLDTKP
jgi:trimethylamine---corrinoid protein Co-methyltransferase